jgi:hypothetical protein
MRILVPALIMIMLPLHGWMGDVMAMEMAIDQLHASHLITSPEGTAKAGGYFGVASASIKSSERDFDEIVAQTAVEAVGGQLESNDNVSSNNYGSCSACHSCHTMGLLAMSHPAFIHVEPTFEATAGHPLLEGITPDPGLKPPIS